MKLLVIIAKNFIPLQYSIQGQFEIWNIIPIFVTIYSNTFQTTHFPVQMEIHRVEWNSVYETHPVCAYIILEVQCWRSSIATSDRDTAEAMADKKEKILSSQTKCPCRRSQRLWNKKSGGENQSRHWLCSYCSHGNYVVSCSQWPLRGTPAWGHCENTDPCLPSPEGHYISRGLLQSLLGIVYIYMSTVVSMESQENGSEHMDYNKGKNWRLLAWRATARSFARLTKQRLLKETRHSHWRYLQCSFLLLSMQNRLDRGRHGRKKMEEKKKEPKGTICGGVWAQRKWKTDEKEDE